MYNHTLFILHVLTYYDFLRILHLEIWIIISHICICISIYIHIDEANIFAAKFLKRAARLGSAFLVIQLLESLKTFPA